MSSAWTATDRFLTQLKGVTDPEEKAQNALAGNFTAVFDEAARQPATGRGARRNRLSCAGNSLSGRN